jgi:hypothetical protein
MSAATAVPAAAQAATQAATRMAGSELSPALQGLLLSAILGGQGAQKPAKREIFRDVAIAAAGANFLPSIGDILGTITGRGVPQGMGEQPPGSSTGKYLIDPSVIADYQQKYNAEQFNRAKLRSIPFIGESLVSQLPVLPTPQEFAESLRRGAEEQMESASQRILKERAQELQSQFDIAQLGKNADIAIAQLAREALVRQAELEGLAGVQKERLRGSYGMAQGVLENAIENVLKSGTITDRSAEVELAKIK